MKRNFLSIMVLTVVLWSCSTSHKHEPIIEKQHYSEKYRPQFHFSPDHNWMNDPNGLVYLDGGYHLFYQYNPYGNVWGHMSWGHAVSKDLLHWEHLPVAIEEYMDNTSGDGTMIFSGSAVIDKKNTSGFFPDDSTGMIAVYTSHLHKNNQQITQHQSIAYSKDKGRTFSLYKNNPVLDIKRKDFRDPKVFWYDPDQKWIMAAVIPDQFKVHFYESKNLKEWKLLSEFGRLGDTAKIWECPDLLQIASRDDPSKKKWVLLISNSHPQGPAFVGMQYFVGDFDGKKFTPENPKQYPLYLEYGKDFYAAVTYNNLPENDNRKILLGWANNWAYGNVIPTSTWRSAMTLPRELYLQKSDKGYQIVQQPLHEIESLRNGEITNLKNNAEKSLEIEYELIPQSGQQAGLKFFKTASEETIVGYDAIRGEVFLDRTKSGNVKFHPAFSSVERVPVKLINGKLKLHIFIDHSIIEVFINDGEQVITDQVFPTSESASVENYFSGEEPVVTIKAWKLKSVWR